MSTATAGTQCTSPSGKRQGSADLTSAVTKKPKLSKEERAQKEAFLLAEKAVREADRLEREKARLEREAAKQADKAAKEAERLEREAEKEKKRKEREEKRREKEEVRAKELAAQEKKEKSQLRMGNFFSKADPKPAIPVLAKEESSIFKPFHLREHTRLAQPSYDAIRPSTSFDDNLLQTETAPSLHDTLGSTIARRRRGRATGHKEVLSLRERLIQFHSDVRPAYFGTASFISRTSRRRPGRKPYRKTSELNYDYDSEADWIEGDEDDAGEELGDDDEMSVTSGDTYGEEGDDFLDDEDDVSPRERRNNGQLLPSISGIFTRDDCAPVEHMRMRRLVDTPWPIDPFENYWDPKPVLSLTNKGLNGSNAKTPTGDKQSLRKSSTNSHVPASFPETLLPAFKKAIQGCTLTKILLVEKLRVDFKLHKISKKTIEDTLGEVARRQGKGQHDVWTLKN